MKCEYGCGKEARYPPGKGRTKWCCSEFPRLCESIKKRYGSPGDKNPMFGKKQTDETKQLISSKLTGRIAIKKYKPVKIDTTELCDYGCGKIANYKLKNGKICCSIHQSSCRKIKRKIGKGVKGKMVGENHPMYGKTHSNEAKQVQSKRSIGNKYSELTYESFLERYPFFPDYEEIRKAKNGRMEVRCKECNKWFEPDVYHKVICYRACAIKHPNHGYGHAYMFCSKKCKLQSSDFYKKKDAVYLSKYDKYKKQVARYTYKSLVNNGDIVKNSNKKVIGDNLDLDHKFSMTEGFKNNIPPKVIGNWRNLEYIPLLENRSKGGKCSISLEEIKKIEEEI